MPLVFSWLMLTLLTRTVFSLFNNLYVKMLVVVEPSLTTGSAVAVIKVIVYRCKGAVVLFVTDLSYFTNLLRDPDGFTLACSVLVLEASRSIGMNCIGIGLKIFLWISDQDSVLRLTIVADFYRGITSLTTYKSVF